MSNTGVRYAFNSRDDWLKCFAEQYNKHYHGGLSSTKYNDLRDPGTPVWETIARNCGVVRWNDLVSAASNLLHKKQRGNVCGLRINKSICHTLEQCKAILSG